MIAFDTASFRDPSGRVFYHGGEVFRTLTSTALRQLHAAERVGLLGSLAAQGLLIEGTIVRARDLGLDEGATSEYVLRQRTLPFVSYPYEWSVEMLRDAALMTLDVLDRSLAAGFVLKDASAFNVLFDGVRPIFIDTPSIEPYVDGRPWIAYGQFCRSFLFPLLLAVHRGVHVQALLRGCMGEVSAGMAARIFSPRDYFRAGVLRDVLIQAHLEKSFGGSTRTVSAAAAAATYPKSLLVSNVRRLRRIIERLPTVGAAHGGWSNYASECPYSNEDRAGKHAFVTAALGGRRRDRIADLGCNTGEYSRDVLRLASLVIAVDLDSAAIDRLYRGADHSDRISPVVADLVNPSPAMGWRLRERRSLLDRLASDGFLALALVHHLRITAGVPLASIIDALFEIAPEGVIEWVDKTDPQVQRLLALRLDVFDDYAWPIFDDLLRQRADVVAVRTAGTRRLYHVREKSVPTAHRGPQ